MHPRPDPRALDARRRLSISQPALPTRPPGERTGDFEEVLLPLDPETARRSAERCIHCPSRICVEACPVGNDIPLALWQIERGDFGAAGEVFAASSTMPEICGRVCPQAALCEGVCAQLKKGNPPVPIGRLEAFAADRLRGAGAASEGAPEPSGHRVAVVGAGPAGLTVAELLARKGHGVTVFDANPRPGGVMRYGIPGFKLDHRLIDEKASALEAAGVRFEFGVRVGTDPSVDSLLGEEGFGAVFLGVGAGESRELDVPGADLDGVESATPFLVRASVPAEDRPAGLSGEPGVGRRVAVVGGGDTAMDCARTAVRLGADEVTVVYRRTEAEMPGNERDRALAREEGTRFRWLAQPVRFVDDGAGRIGAMECVEMRLGEADESGRRRPVPVPGSGFTIDVDTVVLALGYGADPLLGETTPGLETRRGGLLEVDGEGRTSREGVFAGGDDVLGPALVVDAVAHGRRAAEAIDAHLKGGSERVEAA